GAQHLPEVEIAVLPQPQSGGVRGGEPLDPRPQRILSRLQIRHDRSGDPHGPIELRQESEGPALQVLATNGFRRERRLVRRRERAVQLADACAELADLPEQRRRRDGLLRERIDDVRPAIGLDADEAVRDSHRGLHDAFERERAQQRRRGAKAPPRQQRTDLQLRALSLIELADQLEDDGIAEYERSVALLRREPAHSGPLGKRRQGRVWSVEPLPTERATARPNRTASAEDRENGEAGLLIERLLERSIVRFQGQQVPFRGTLAVIAHLDGHDVQAVEA